jgi:hypothetical protein
MLAPCLHIALVSSILSGDPVAGDGKPEIVRQLKEYYEQSSKVPPWQAAVGRLNTKDPEQRKLAAQYLSDLLEQSLRDERSGAAPWQATPYWGSSGENPARNLRTSIADALKDATLQPEALPVVRWLVEREFLARQQALAAEALAKIDGKAADEFRAALASAPHANAAVAVAALRQCQERSVDLPKERLAVLAQHYRSSIREAARAILTKRGGPEPAPLDRVRAVQTEPVRALMAKLAALVLEPAPADAKFVIVTTTHLDAAGKKVGESQTTGWLQTNNNELFEVLTLFGEREVFRKAGDKDESRPGRRDGGKRTHQYRPTSVADEVARVAEAREKGAVQFALSKRGGLTGQFEGQGAGLYEALLASWLYSKKDYDLASRVLLPALDSVYRDDYLLEMTKARLGSVYGYRMLVAFIGDRDYPKALKFAKILAEHFDGNAFHDYAVRLAEQLPKRGDDFGKLRLPTPREWAALKAKMTRADQIHYLCQRMRLLNCFQWGQPGGFGSSDEQYAEPSGLSSDAAWRLREGGTEVINPVYELAGRIDGFRIIGEKGAEGLQLAVGDLPLLAPYLRDDWFILAVSFWRDFHPARNMHTTRGVFAMLINEVAKRKLCEPDKMAGMTDAERTKYIEDIVRWAAANAGKNEMELLLAGLEEDLEEERFPKFNIHISQIDGLVALKGKGAVPILARFIEEKLAKPTYLYNLLDECNRIDPDATRQLARRLLHHKSFDFQVEAAWNLHILGDKQEALTFFARAVESPRLGEVGEFRLWNVVATLLEEKSKESRDSAARICTNPVIYRSYGESIRGRIMAYLVEKGCVEPFQFYKRMLAVEGNKLDDRLYEQPVAVAFAYEVTHVFRDDPGIKEIVKTCDKPAEVVSAVRKWLDDRIKNSSGKTKDGP